MAHTTKRERRVAALAALLAEYHAAPTDYDRDEEEDPRPFLDGRRAPRRFVCVTEHEGKPFFLPTFDTSTAAQERAVHYMRDDIWPETPVAVVDLDTGDRWYPETWNMPWALAPRDPEARGTGAGGES